MTSSFKQGALVRCIKNDPSKKSGTVDFPGVSLAEFENGDTVTFVARAYQGNKNAGVFKDSQPVNVIIKKLPPFGEFQDLACTSEPGDDPKYSGKYVFGDVPNKDSRYKIRIVIKGTYKKGGSTVLGPVDLQIINQTNIPGPKGEIKISGTVDDIPGGYDTVQLDFITEGLKTDPGNALIQDTDDTGVVICERAT